MSEVPRFDAEYSPEQIGQFYEWERTLDEYNRALERWADEGYRGPRPKEPKIRRDEMYQLRKWQEKRMEASLDE